MVDTGIFATTAEIGYKAGAGKSAVSSAEAYTNNFISQAESFINAYTKINYSDTYASLNVDKKALLKEAASNIAAMYVINYDMTGFPSLSYVQTMLNILWDRAVECMKILTDNDKSKFVSSA